MTVAHTSSTNRYFADAVETLDCFNVMKFEIKWICENSQVHINIVSICSYISVSLLFINCVSSRHLHVSKHSGLAAGLLPSSDRKDSWCGEVGDEQWSHASIAATRPTW